MRIEWDDEKNAKVRAERGASFEELAETATGAGYVGFISHPRNPGQRLMIVRFRGEVWVIVAEARGELIRFVTAYPSRKMRKKYGN